MKLCRCKAETLRNIIDTDGNSRGFYPTIVEGTILRIRNSHSIIYSVVREKESAIAMVLEVHHRRIVASDNTDPRLIAFPLVIGYCQRRLVNTGLFKGNGGIKSLRSEERRVGREQRPLTSPQRY